MNNKPTTPNCQINDAVLSWWAGDAEIRRVIAITEDGRAVIRTHCNYKVEDKPGEWPRVGSFVRHRRWWSCWLISTWQFVNF